MLLLEHEPLVRAGSFAAVLLLCVALERLRPRRTPAAARAPRWRANLGLVLVDTLVVRLLFPFLAVGTALAVESTGFGLFNQFVWPPALELVAAVLLLDLAIYGQHRLMHALPTMWRLHRVHHSDLEFDVTTGVRFHPAEMVASMLIKIAIVALLGPAAAAVVVFEVLLNATALFNHSNVRVPAAVEPWLRLLLVTPDVHRVHHSTIAAETDSNFGFNFPWWDRLFGTYRAQPRDGHQDMRIGLDAFRTPSEQTLLGLLVQPVASPAGALPPALIGGEHT
jgi:sterol desaturase/sphingolipid hydroxylase (fatty acid hydroxylase superfamily)